MGSADPQPGLGFLVKLSNRQCRHAVNAITASYGCKAAYEEPIHPCFQGRFASQPLHVARLSFRQQPANVMVDLTSLLDTSVRAVRHRCIPLRARDSAPSAVTQVTEARSTMW